MITHLNSNRKRILKVLTEQNQMESYNPHVFSLKVIVNFVIIVLKNRLYTIGSGDTLWKKVF